MNWKYYSPQFLFEKNLRCQDSAWIGHVNFAYDLVINTKPKVVVELGTHRGHSFFSFAQAVKDSSLKTKLFAIDNWEGDKQAGFYGNEIYKSVDNISREFYGNQNIILLRGYFKDFLGNFKDKSIDILHIDGLHTYSAVKSDFQEWIPKVKDDGIILLHDVSEKSKGFGVYKLWDELKKQYKTLEMDHSHGLGIIFLDSHRYNQFKDYINIWRNYYPKCYKLTIALEQLSENKAIINNLNKSEANKMEIIKNLETELLAIKSTKTWKTRELIKKNLKT